MATCTNFEIKRAVDPEEKEKIKLNEVNINYLDFIVISRHLDSKV